MRALMILCAGVVLALGAQAVASDTSFTYQGRLNDGGEPANGKYDLTFDLYDAAVGGTQLAGPFLAKDVVVTEGLFTTEVDFKAGPWTDAELYLEIQVDGTPLSPRQPVTRTPFATQTRGIFVDDDERVSVGIDVTSSSTMRVWNDGNNFRALDVQAITGNGIDTITADEDSYALFATAQNLNGAAIFAFNNLTNNLAFLGGSVVSVDAVSEVENGIGVQGRADAPGGLGGRFETIQGTYGVLGIAQSKTATTRGVGGTVFSDSGIAVDGFCANDSAGTAIRGVSNNINGWAGRFLGRVFMRDHTTVGKEGVRITTAEAFGVHTTAEANQFGGMYVSGQNATSLPFYGYSAGGTTNDVDAYHYYDGDDLEWNLWVGGLTRLTVKDQGLVGIGDSNPGFTLEVNGSAGKPGGGSWSVSSDARLKKNVRDLDGALDDLTSLRGVTFEYIDPDAIGEFPGERIGMVAQEVEQVFPDWVETTEHGYKAVTFRGFEALTVEALRELRAEKDEQIAQLEAENEALRARLAALESSVARALAAHEESQR